MNNLPKLFTTAFCRTVIGAYLAFNINANLFSQDTGSNISDEGITWENSFFELYNKKADLNFESKDFKLKSTSSEDPILTKINDSIYQTEHILFIIPSRKVVEWPDYQSIFGDEESPWGNKKIDEYYIPVLTKLFPYDFNTVVIISDTASPNYVPNYVSRRLKATGINQNATNYTDIDICRYNIGGGATNIGAINWIDHEMGHGWGVYIRPNDGGHWPNNSTVVCRMDNHWNPVRFPSGDPDNGFYWQAQSDLIHQKINYSMQQLYLMGLQPTFPETYLLNDAVFNSDFSVSYSSYEKFDQKTIIDNYGPRIPDYRTSKKKFKVGFIFVAPNLQAINSRYSNLEKEIRYFTCSTEREEDPFSSYYYATVPFSVCTNFRASLDSKLSDLDGNNSPQLEVTKKYYKIIPGETDTIDYTTSDIEDGIPNISWYPSEKLSFYNNLLIFDSKGEEGTYFYTLKATDSGGKVTFDHIVIEVATSAFLSVSTSTLEVDASASNTATFEITSNTNWNITSDQPWLTFSSDSGSNNSAITIYVSTNNTPNVRTATITISGDGVDTKLIIATQEAIILPGITEVINPANNAVDVQTPVQIVLNETTNASQYEIVVAADSNFSIVIIDTIIDGLSVTIPLQKGVTYYVKAIAKNSNGNGLWSASSLFTTEYFSGIDDHLFENILIYPNPFTNIAHFIYPYGRIVLIEIYDPSGRSIRKIQDTDQNGETSVDLSGVNGGLYIYQISFDDVATYHGKIIKE